MLLIAAIRWMNGLPLIAFRGLWRKTTAALGGGAFPDADPSPAATVRGIVSASAASSGHGRVRRTRANVSKEGVCAGKQIEGGDGHYNLPLVHRNFVKFTFLKVDPAWRRLPPAERETHKREFAAACDDFGADRFLRAFSLVGTRGDAYLLLWCSSPGLTDIHEFHVVLGQSGLMGWAKTPYSYLAMTKESEYSEEERLE